MVMVIEERSYRRWRDGTELCTGLDRARAISARAAFGRDALVGGRIPPDFVVQSCLGIGQSAMECPGEEPLPLRTWPLQRPEVTISRNMAQIYEF